MLLWLALVAFASGRGVVAMSFPSDVMSLRSPSGATCDITKHGAHVLSWSQSSGKNQGPYKKSLYLTHLPYTHTNTYTQNTQVVRQTRQHIYMHAYIYGFYTQRQTQTQQTQ
jgi:hypothetical protein